MPYEDSRDADGGTRAIDDAQLKKLLASERPSMIERNRYRLITIVLIALNVVIYGLEVLNSGFRFDIPPQVLVDMGAMYAPAIQSASDLYRFVAPMFLHVDLMHIAFNMVALFSVGEVLERVLGRGGFLLLYFVGGITGNAVSFAADALSAGHATVSAGASTSVFGLFVAVALLGLLHRGNRRVFAQYSRSMLWVIGINVLYTFLMPSISITGHLGGAIGGFIAMFMVPSKNLRVPNAVRALVAAAWVGSLAVLLVSQGLLVKQ